MRDSLRQRLLSGLVIPAHPLALDAHRKLDERSQRAISRYYLSAGAGGLAVAVHTTQFAIHDPGCGLLDPVLGLAAEEAERFEGTRPIMVAGLIGNTDQAVREAEMAKSLGYDIGLLGLNAFTNDTTDRMLGHARAVASVMPIMGFYLQPAVGGRVLPYEFWCRFAEIENVVAIKIAPFNRYQTLDVIRAVADVERQDQIALYTGNDDSIVVDLLTEFPFDGLRFVGGLLGHWAVWTKRAVELFQAIQEQRSGGGFSIDWLARAAEITDCNAAFFDAAGGFAGCIPGIHEVLRRQGLLQGTWTLNPSETLTPGQVEEIDRVYAAYPHLNDDEFVAENLDRWLSG